MANNPEWVESLNNVNQDRLPGMVGMVVTHAEPGLMKARMEAKPELIAPIGFLFAPALVTLADTLCAYGMRLPEGANGFTTAELKCNFVSTIQSGAVLCEAKLVHGGRTT
jgi:1,4-dihydroxy-2-naphthoyl-CoA hydrolase